MGMRDHTGSERGLILPPQLYPGFAPVGSTACCLSSVWSVRVAWQAAVSEQHAVHRLARLTLHPRDDWA